MTASTQTRDFSGLHAAMQRTVDGELLAGVSSAVLHGRDLVDLHCAGFADRERGIKLGEDHLFRMFSSTKLVTSCAVLMLMEEGKLGLDDPIERFIPQLGNRQVLKPGATLADPNELVAWCRERMAAYKCPKTVDVVAELPRNPTGKVLKRDLRKPYWEGRDRQVA
jgi:hypothetical protein